MDQTFTFRAAPEPLRRRLQPRTIVLAFVMLIAACGLLLFSRWVVDSERRSMERAARSHDTSLAVGTLSDATEARDEGSVRGRLAIDATAQAEARRALTAARRIAAGPATFLDAGPWQLGATGSASIFVDGVSRAPGVVSVASSRDAWAAAVMGASGTCYLVRFAPGSGATYGSGPVCTGEAALAARDPSW